MFTVILDQFVSWCVVGVVVGAAAEALAVSPRLPATVDPRHVVGQVHIANAG
jgi:hypothetical protein